MAKITSYATLQSEAIAELERTDLTTQIVRFIQNAEERLNRDHRVKRLVSNTSFTVDAATKSLPSNFKMLDSISWPGTGTAVGDLLVVSYGDLSSVYAQYGATGKPRVVAIVPGSDEMTFAPVPDEEYTLAITYWEGVPELGGAVLSNWLLDSHSDIYLYATCLEAAPYLVEDERISTWSALLEQRLQDLHTYTQNRTYGGPMSVPAVQSF